MTPASRRKIAGQRAAPEVDIIVPSNLPNDPWRIVNPERQTVVVAKLRVSGPRPRSVAVEYRAEGGDLIRERGLHADAGHSDRRRRTAGRQVGSHNGRPTERPVDEQIVRLAVEK